MWQVNNSLAYVLYSIESEMDRSWMYLENRVTQEYINGVDDFLLVARDDMLAKGAKFMCCPC